MKHRSWLMLFGSLLLFWLTGLSAQAAFEPSVEYSYNLAVQGLDTLDDLDVFVAETTVSSQTNLSSVKEVEVKTSGKKTNALKGSISVNSEEGQTESYYKAGYYYTTVSGKQVKQEMDSSDFWELVNSHIYLNLTSNYLKMLSSEINDGGLVAYHYAATGETLGDYAKRLIGRSAQERGVAVDLLIGTMITDAQGHILNRSTQMVYTVDKGAAAETYLISSKATFYQNENGVTVLFPDLTQYQEPKPEAPIVTITRTEPQTVYVTADVNVRAEGNTSSAILGGFSAGSGVTRTGYTSDGWVQVQYNGSTGYVWGGYVSLTKPVITKDSSGAMYATVPVNVRSTYSSEGTILGVLARGEGVEVTGTTDNGWIRIKYKGQTGYVYADYLSRSEPVVETYVQSGSVSGRVMEASYGTLTIRLGDGNLMVFNTTYAQMQLKDSLFTGDLVDVEYYGSEAPYTASKVVDNISHENGVSASSYTVSGVVISCSKSLLELSGSDGVYRTFDISEADLEMEGRPKQGQYVMVTWMSYTDGEELRNIPALRVMG